MAWRLARSLNTLRAEVDRYAPNRSKVSDGTLGDPAHASRPSRHNPNRYGVVTALDITHDPAHGCDIHAIARRLVKNPHPELAYVISNGQVFKRSTGFRAETYTGANPHDKHAHFGVGQGPDSDPLPPYDSTQPWGVSLPTPPALTPPEDGMYFLKKKTDPAVWFFEQGRYTHVTSSTDGKALAKAAGIAYVVGEVSATFFNRLAKGRERSL